MEQRMGSDPITSSSAGHLSVPCLPPFSGCLRVRGARSYPTLEDEGEQAAGRRGA